ncbi:MAG: fasciclin domain-containing protein [Phycisphaerales bacterium JB039]
MRVLASVLAALTLAVAVAPAGAAPHRLTLAEIVARSGGDFDDNPVDFDLLLTALKAADLVGPLADPAAELTVFGPPDFAFVTLARDLGYTGYDEAGAWTFLVDTLTVLGGGDPIPVLTDVLLYHVVDGKAYARDLILATIFRKTIPTLQGGVITPFFFFLGDAEPDLDDPVVLFPNIRASNGVLHVISGVLIPVDLP